jgi:hypothetical protein
MSSKILLILLSCLSLFSCKKPAGEGGNSSIKGTVWVQDYDKNMNVLQYQYSGVDVEVYIIYGDDVTSGDKVNTNANGEFEFKYLRKGNYKVYAISKEKIGTTNDTKDVAVSLEVTLSKNKQTVDAGQITIKQ